MTQVAVHIEWEDGTQSSSETLEISTAALGFESPVFEFPVPMENDGVITVFGLAQDLGAYIQAEFVGITREGEIVWWVDQETPPQAQIFGANDDGLLLNYYPSGSQGSGRIYDLLSITSDTVARFSPFSMHHDGAPCPMEISHPCIETARRGSGTWRGPACSAIAEVTPDGSFWEWNSFDHLDTNRFPVGVSQINSGDWTTETPSTTSLRPMNCSQVFNQNQVMTMIRTLRRSRAPSGKMATTPCSRGLGFGANTRQASTRAIS